MIKILLALWVVLLGVGAAPSVEAAGYDYPATPVYYTCIYSGYACNTYRPERIDACKDLAASNGPVYGPPGTYTYVRHTDTVCTIKDSSNAEQSRSFMTSYSCPYGGTRNTSNVCIGGTAPAPSCTAGKQVTVTYKTGTFVPPSDFKTDPALVPPVNGSSDGTCEIKIVDVKGCVGKSDGFTYCTYVGEQSGNLKAPATGVPAPSGTGGTGAPGPTDTQVPVPPFTGQPGGGCPKGTVQGGVGPDGVPMCMGTGSNPPMPPKTPSTTTKPPTTTTGADGSTTTTQETSQKNADGSTTTTTTTTTTAPDGTKTTSSNTVNSGTPSGGAGRTDTADADKTNFCKQNPNLAVCRESSVSGTCGQTSCVGDAIQCATLRAAAEMSCKQKADDDALKASSLYSLGQAASGGNDPLASTLPTVQNASIVNVPTMAASGWIGAGSAFRDVSFTVQGRTFAIPLEKWTGYLVGLRYALMVVAMLVSFRMLSGVILRD